MIIWLNNNAIKLSPSPPFHNSALDKLNYFQSLFNFPAPTHPSSSGRRFGTIIMFKFNFTSAAAHNSCHK